MAPLSGQNELLFTRLETTLRLYQPPATKVGAVRALSWAAVSSLLVSGVLGTAMRRVRPDRVFPPERIDALSRDFAELTFWAMAAERRTEPLNLSN